MALPTRQPRQPRPVVTKITAQPTTGRSTVRTKPDYTGFNFNGLQAAIDAQKKPFAAPAPLPTFDPDAQARDAEAARAASEAAAAKAERDKKETAFNADIERQKIELRQAQTDFEGRARAQQIVTRSRYGADVNGKLNFENPTDPYSRTAELRRQYEGLSSQQTASQFGRGIGRDGAAMAQDYELSRDRGGAVKRLTDEFTDSETATTNALADSARSTESRVAELSRRAFSDFVANG